MRTQKIIDEESGTIYEIDIDKTVWSIGSGEIVDAGIISVARAAFVGALATDLEFVEACKEMVREGLFDKNGQTVKGLLVWQELHPE